MKPLKKSAIALLAALLAIGSGSVHAQSGAEVFDLPMLHKRHEILSFGFRSAMARKDAARLEELALEALRFFPSDPVWRYNLACLKIAKGDVQGGIAELDRAAKDGFSDVDTLLSDPDLAGAKEVPDFAEILETVRANSKKSIPPALLGAAAPVTGTNVLWNMETGMLSVLLKPGADAALPSPLTGGRMPLLDKWHAEGLAAGNMHDIYDNRDGGHSLLDTSLFPGMAKTLYSGAAKERNAHLGPSFLLFPGRIAIGNSSMANTDTNSIYWGSVGRMLQTDHARRLFLQYVSNVLYVYPQHQDYREGFRGDLFPVRTPYAVISPGSSWSDKPLLEAMGYGLMAMRPETKDFIAKNGLAAPVLQYLLRASNPALSNRTDYLAPAAHPVVLDGNAIDTEKLVRLANSLTPANLAPLAPLRVVYDQSDSFRPVADYPGMQPERFFDTPFSIARVWRAPAAKRKMKLAVAAPKMPGVKFHWFLGQGDDKKIKITPSDGGYACEVEIAYHPSPFKTPFGVRSSRADVICVADNGVNFSAPSFVTWFFPPNETRHYDAEGKPVMIDYLSKRDVYVHPGIAEGRNFRDFFKYDYKGRFLEIERTDDAGRKETRSSPGGSGL